MKYNSTLHLIKKKFFDGKVNSILTILAALLLIYVVPNALSWLVFNAVWTGTPQECLAVQDGACWSFVFAKLGQFTYGFYPHELRWRVNIVGILFFIGLFSLMIEKTPYKKWIALFMLTIFPFLAWSLLYGSIFGLTIVPTSRWGGLMLTLVIAVFGIVASLPVGIVLALGRRSAMPIIKTICVVFIEFWRGVPLITVLFMSSVMLPLFFQEGFSVNELIRALIGVALFASAYMAEVVRGGLQAISKGQYEAADSLGLNYFKKMFFIILPQALRIVIPGIVNTFIGLFKDTTLVLIIALFDLLGIVQAGISDPKWSVLTVPYTGYAFVAIVFFVFCYGMSLYSKKIERKLQQSK